MAKIGLSATYFEAGDFVGVNVYLEQDGLLHPELIQRGVAQLIVQDGVLQTADFDASYGTSEGAVTVTFLHPLRVHNLSVNVFLTIAPNGDDLRASVPVTTDPLLTEDFDVVAQQQTEQEPLDVYPHEPGVN